MKAIDPMKAEKVMNRKAMKTATVLFGQLNTNYSDGVPCSTDIMNEVYATTPKDIMASALNIVKENGWTVEEKDNKLVIW